MGKKQKGRNPNNRKEKDDAFAIFKASSKQKSQPFERVDENNVVEEKKRIHPNRKQSEVARLLGVYDGVHLYLENSWGEPLEGNPYYVMDNNLYNSLSQIDDDVLGKLIRKNVYITSSRKDGLEDGEDYFYLTPERKILHKENSFDVTDLMNLMIGNYFISKESVNEKEVKRVLSVFSLIKESQRNLFPYEVKEPDFIVSSILGITTQEKNKRSIIGEDDDLGHGFLKQNFEKNG